MSRSACVVEFCRRHLSPGDSQTPLYLIPSGYDSTGQKQDHLERRRVAWISALTERSALTEEQLKNGRVCGRHFVTGRPSREDLEDDPDWIPNQALGPDDESKEEEEEELFEFVASGTGTGAGENVVDAREKTRCCACKRLRKVDGPFLISYYLFPQNREIRKAWLRFVNKSEGDLPVWARLCTRHFTKDQTYQTVDGVKLKKNAVPTLTVPKQKYTKRSQVLPTATVPRPREITITRKRQPSKTTVSTCESTVPVAAPAPKEPPDPGSEIDPLYFPLVTVKEERPDRDYESPEFVTESDLMEISQETDVSFEPVRIKEEIVDATNNDLIEVKHEPLYRESSAVEGEPVNGYDVSGSPIKRRTSSSERVDPVNRTVMPEPKKKVMRLFKNGFRAQDLSNHLNALNHDHTYSLKIQKRKPRKKIQVPRIVVKSQADNCYKCHFCSYDTEYKSFLVSHLNRTHGHERSKSEPDENGMSWQPGSRIFCPYCMDTFPKEDPLMQHMLLQHLFTKKPVQKTSSDLSASGTVYNCPHCLLRCADSDKLSEHVRKKHSSTYRCGECAFTCHVRETFVRHSRVHFKGYKFFRCADCLELHAENSMTVHRCSSIPRPSDPTDEELKNQLKDKMERVQEHRNAETGMFECPGCHYTVEKEDVLKEHLLAVHTKVLLRFFCNSCMFHSDRKCAVIMHQQYTHKTNEMIDKIMKSAGTYANDAGVSADADNAARASDAGPAATLARNKKPLKREFRCRFCGYKTKLRFYLNQHMKQQHSLGKPLPVLVKTDAILLEKKASESLLPTKTTPGSLSTTTKSPPSQNKVSPERPVVQSRLEEFIKVLRVRNPDYAEGDPEFMKKLTMFKCSLCAYCNRCKKATENHLRSKHTYNEVTYSCPFCDLNTKYKSYLQMHLNSKHMEKLMQGPGVKVRVVTLLQAQKENQLGGSNGNKLTGVRTKKQEARAKGAGVGLRKRISKPPNRLDL